MGRRGVLGAALMDRSIASSRATAIVLARIGV